MKSPIAMRNGIRTVSRAAHRSLEAAAGPNPRYPDKESAHSRDSCSAGAVVFKRRNSTACQRYGRRDDQGPDSCSSVLDGDVSYLMYPSSADMVFYSKLYHAARACEEAITIPWAGMRPFLSLVGEQAVRSLMGKRGGASTTFRCRYVSVGGHGERCASVSIRSCCRAEPRRGSSLLRDHSPRGGRRFCPDTEGRNQVGAADHVAGGGSVHRCQAERPCAHGDCRAICARPASPGTPAPAASRPRQAGWNR
jgi:hypothetical protein